MTCPPGRPSFRLLDPRVGWDPASAEGLESLDFADSTDGDGSGPGGSGSSGGASSSAGKGTLRLAALAGPGTDPAAVAGVFGDRRLARGCGPCEWYVLVTRPAPGLLRLGPCGPRSSLGPGPLAGPGPSEDHGFSPVWGRGRAPFLPDPVAVAARGRRVAVADRLLRQVLVWDGGGDRLIARLVLDRDPVALAIAPWGEVLVAVAGEEQVRRFGLHGGARPPAPWQVPGQVVAIAFGRADAGSCPVILLVRAADGALTCWLTDRQAADAVQASLAGAAELAGPSGVAAAGDRGFCLASVATGTAASQTWNNQDDPPVQSCWSWCGEPLTSDDIGAPAPRPLVRQGQLLTRAVDSGIPRCLWHRLRVDADVPPGTSLDIAVATSEAGDEQPPKDTLDDPAWAGFASGVPHADDWEQLPPGATDVLLRRPPGRYLFLRARLTGDGMATPVVHSIRLDFPRVTSLDQLPGVWQDDAAGADFTARFLSLFDASLGELDRVMERYPALLQAGAVPGEVLPWLAGLLGLGFDPSWPVARRRALVQAAPELYRLRGTPEGLRRAIELVFNVVPVIEELGAARAWGALARPGAGTPARLGSVRLFGPSRVRFRLDRSVLSRTPVRSLGDPRLDAQGSDAYRFRVLISPGAGGVDVPRLERLVGSQAQAHTVATVRVGGTGLVVGQQSSVGVDTLLVGPPAPVLGSSGGTGGTVRLSRHSVLWPGRHYSGTAMRAGDRSVVGVNTVVR